MIVKVLLYPPRDDPASAVLCGADISQSRRENKEQEFVENVHPEVCKGPR